MILSNASLSKKFSMPDNNQLELLPVRYDTRFLETHAGNRILADPTIAVIELIANAWDAYACHVNIRWPNKNRNQTFSIEDDGSGMTADEFQQRWMTLAYNRREYQGEYAEAPPNRSNKPPRMTFGKNGLGRHAGFCFSETDEFFVETAKDGQLVKFRVWIPIHGEYPLACKQIEQKETDSTGTKIYTTTIIDTGIDADEIRSQIGLRFLRDPEFQVTVDDQLVTFSDLPKDNIHEIPLQVEDVGDLLILAINTQKADRTTKHHGIAWHVQDRLVGEASWKTFNDNAFIDGRSREAKQYGFIIKADPLKDLVKSDWTGFNEDHNNTQKCIQLVNEEIKKFLLDLTRTTRLTRTQELQETNRHYINEMSLMDASIWNSFINKVQEECNSIRPSDLDNIASILAKLEASKNQYSLLNKLKDISINDFDKLDDILSQWDIETAKTVLNELQTRLKLIDEIRKKIDNDNADEIKELQPLFKRGLWIFGPEFETIEYTSNEGMTKVIQKIFKSEGKGSRNRPDFVITTDSTVGIYSRPEYDDQGSELGPKNIVIVELKAPDVPLGDKEIEQPWKYIQELLEKGHFDEDFMTARCFGLGRDIKRYQGGKSSKMDGRVEIFPLRYEDFLTRARSRTLNLYNKVRKAPFLNREEIDDFLEKGGVNDGVQQSLEL